MNRLHMGLTEDEVLDLIERIDENDATITPEELFLCGTHPEVLGELVTIFEHVNATHQMKVTIATTPRIPQEPWEFDDYLARLDLIEANLEMVEVRDFVKQERKKWAQEFAHEREVNQKLAEIREPSTPVIRLIELFDDEDKRVKRAVANTTYAKTSVSVAVIAGATSRNAERSPVSEDMSRAQLGIELGIRILESRA